MTDKPAPPAVELDRTTAIDVRRACLHLAAAIDRALTQHAVPVDRQAQRPVDTEAESG